MVISEKGLCAAMNVAFKKKSVGYKVAVQRSEKGVEEIVLSAPGWTAIITRENAPQKVLALIVEHMGDLPKEGEAFQVQDKKAQAEILSMAVPDEGDAVVSVTVKRTQLNYNGYQIWQRTNDQKVFMMPAQREDMLDSYNRQVCMTEKGMFCAKGVASRLYIQPLQVAQNEMPALHHLAKLQWV